MRPFPEELHSRVELHNSLQEPHELLEHLTFSTTSLLQNFSTIVIVEVHPVAPECAHSANPQLLGSLMFEECPKPLVGFVLVQVKAAVKIDKLHWDSLLEAGIAQLRFLLAEHFPNQRLAVVDGVHHVVLQVGVDAVDHLHHLVTNRKR
jgi:hypothetical protein